MKIVIPMAGRGVRFGKFQSPKPLLEIEGKPLIEKVIQYFPRKAKFVFICHETDLLRSNMRETLSRICPGGEIVSISDEYIRGPAYSLLPAFDKIPDDEEIIVNYCDFIQTWDFDDFITKVREKKAAGAVVTFRGFHPSSLGETKFATAQLGPNGMVTSIGEKANSDERLDDYSLTGSHYFASGKLLKEYVKKNVSNEKNTHKNEFYVSLVFNEMIRDGLSVVNYEAKRFICLGTQRDFELYRFWSEFFAKYAPNSMTFEDIGLNLTNIFPIAGGERDFASTGFNGPNFLLPVMNKTLLDYSYNSTPKGSRNVFVANKSEIDMLRKEPTFNQWNSEIIFQKEYGPKPHMTGNAVAVFSAKDMVKPDDSVCVSGATYFIDYNHRKLANLMEQDDVEAIIFSFSHHECILRDPNAFAYARIRNNIEVDQIVEKQTVSKNPYSDQALTGTAIFKKSSLLFEAIEKEMKKANEGPVFYLSSLNNILKNHKVVLFEVDKFVPIRTIVNYKEFCYWQNYFNEIPEHPYSKILQ